MVYAPPRPKPQALRRRHAAAQELLRRRHAARIMASIASAEARPQQLQTR